MSWKSRLEEFLREKMDAFQIPGLAIGIVEDREPVYVQGFGVMKLGSGKPVTPRSLFHTASVTKPFVATAVMQFVESGRVDLDARVTDYLPYFKMNDARASAITLRQMLSHTSGIPDTDDYGWDTPEYDAGALERYVRSVSGLALNRAPGEGFEYSNIAYEVLGDVIAKASGESFEDYVHEHIFMPLGMRRSTLMAFQADPESLAAPHVSDADGRVRVCPVFPYNRAHSPSSTLCSTVEEMNLWAMANLNRGELEGKRILQASSYESLWKPHSPGGTTRNQTVGLSWFLYEADGHRFVKHKGQDIGFTSILLLAPDDGVSVVILTNYSPPSGGYVDEMGRTAMKLLLGDA